MLFRSSRKSHESVILIPLAGPDGLLSQDAQTPGLNPLSLAEPVPGPLGTLSAVTPSGLPAFYPRPC